MSISGLLMTFMSMLCYIIHAIHALSARVGVLAGTMLDMSEASHMPEHLSIGTTGVTVVHISCDCILLLYQPCIFYFIRSCTK